MKLVNSNRKANLILSRFVFCAMMVFLYSCGGGGGGGDDDDGGGDGSGNLSFSLKFEEPDGNFPSALSAALSPSGDICVDYGIKTISVEVFDSSNTAVASDRWPCSAHKGTINDVPTGSGISLEVVGTVDGDDGESNDWHGKIGNLSVFPDENTNAGEVDMYYIGDDKTPPEVDSTDPSNNATDIPRNADITCTFSEDIVHASVNEETFTLHSGTETLTGTVTYDLMDLIATFKPDSNLDYCTTYSATISKKVEDRAGNKMAEDFSWSFTTLPEDNKSKFKWYKDSDKDKYSDGTEKISCDKPGDDYYLEPDLLSTSGDCNDNDASINPEATEICDGIDNNCDGGADEDLSRVTSCGVGACASNTGIETCTAGQWGNDTCNPLAGATPEICDGQDNDCDGGADEDLSRVTSCGIGTCADNTGIETCTAGQWGNDTCNPLAGATPEICDGQDNNCNGSVDEDLSRVTSCGVGACTGNTGEETCTDGQWGENTCDPLAGATSEIPCDTIDQDCDGEDLCISETFDFEELTPTYVDIGPGDPRPGELTSLPSTRSGITIDIYREGAIVFDTVDNTSGSQTGKPGFGNVSLDPFADFSDSAFIVDFSIPVSSVSVDMGDFNKTFDGPVQDDDVLMLEAYSLAGASGALLDSDQIDLPDTPSEIRTWSSETLSVTPASGCIESIRMIGGSTVGPNSVFYDNIVVEAPCEDIAGPNNPPAFLPIDPFLVNYGQEIQFTVTAEDDDALDILTISADLSDLPAASGATFEQDAARSGTFRWTPYAADFPKPLSSLTFLFGEFGGNLNIEINNDFRNFNNFSELNGLTIGGAIVSVTNGFGNDSGEVSISGPPIDSFAIGGQELWIDDFCYQTGCVDFEDLTVGTSYVVNDSFIDSGANIFANPFTWSNGTETSTGSAIVENSGRAGGSGNEMRCDNINLDFLFGYTVLYTVTDNGQPPLNDALRKSFTWIP